MKSSMLIYILTSLRLDIPCALSKINQWTISLHLFLFLAISQGIGIQRNIDSWLWIGDAQVFYEVQHFEKFDNSLAQFLI